MSSTPVWHGLFPALWTPTDAEGRLQRQDLADQVRFLRQAGVDGVMILGSTGEFVHLDMPTRLEILRVVGETVPGWPVIANCSDVSPRNVAVLGKAARETGAASVSLLPPWFFASAGVDVVEFMVRGAEAAGLPLMIYNFPERTGHRLSLETVAAICDRVPVAGLKQSGAEFAYHRDLAALAKEKNFTLITGADTRIPDAFALGARGVVSGLCNALPEPIVAVFQAVRRGQPEMAKEAGQRLGEFAAQLKGLEFALDVAAAMQARGRPTGAFKQWVSPTTRARFAEVVTGCQGLLRAWGMVG